MKGKTLLKVTGILMIIGSVIMILTGALGIVGAVEASKYYETAVLVGMAETLYILTAASVICLLAGILELITGILGVANCAKPEKAKICLIFGIIVIVISVASDILMIAGGTEVNVVSLITGFIVPILYIVGAYLNMKEA